MRRIHAAAQIDAVALNDAKDHAGSGSLKPRKSHHHRFTNGRLITNSAILSNAKDLVLADKKARSRVAQDD